MHQAKKNSNFLANIQTAGMHPEYFVRQTIHQLCVKESLFSHGSMIPYLGTSHTVWRKKKENPRLRTTSQTDDSLHRRAT